MRSYVSVALSLLPEEIERPAHKIKRHCKEPGHPLMGGAMGRAARLKSWCLFDPED